MGKTTKEESKVFKPLKGYEDIYEVNEFAVVRRITGSKPQIISPYLRDGYYCIKLRDKGGKRKEHKLSRLVALTWLPEPPSLTWFAIHKNGLKTDCYAGNLEWVSREECGRLTGSRATRRPVLKIDGSGEVIQIFRSVKEASKKCFMSYNMILNHLHGRVKRGYTADGYRYQYEEAITG